MRSKRTAATTAMAAAIIGAIVVASAANAGMAVAAKTTPSAIKASFQYCCSINKFSIDELN